MISHTIKKIFKPRHQLVDDAFSDLIGNLHMLGLKYRYAIVGSFNLKLRGIISRPANDIDIEMHSSFLEDISSQMLPLGYSDDPSNMKDPYPDINGKRRFALRYKENVRICIFYSDTVRYAYDDVVLINGDNVFLSPVSDIVRAKEEYIRSGYDPHNKHKIDLDSINRFFNLGQL